MRASRIPYLALAAILLILAPARAYAQTAAPAGPKTDVNIYEPYNGDVLNSDVTVTGSAAGSCNSPSQIDVNRADAWACTIAYKVYDPCFANADGTELACPNLPSIGSGQTTDDSLMSVVLVKPTDPLDPTQANTPGPDATPFLVELTDGEFCVPEPANVVFASLPIFGWCTSGYWFGPGDLSQALWTLPILQGGSSVSVSKLANIGILRLWY